MNLRGRVVEVQRIHTSVVLDSGETVLATVRGEFHETGEYPKVGDWVEVSLIDKAKMDQAVIETVLPRTSVIERLDQESLQSQILVTNIDVIFIVMGLDGDFNPKRLERYLSLATQSKIDPVIILNKADIAENLEEKKTLIAGMVGDVPVHIVSAKTGEEISSIKGYFESDTTAVLLGSSGAGKSTITNWLLEDEVQDTKGVREGDSRGRHTTTTRQLFTLPGGGFLIDTPGMRELSLVKSDENNDDSVIDQVQKLAYDCQFSNCDHDKSVGCAVLAAVEQGELEISSLENYYKLMREREWQQDKTANKTRYGEQNSKRSAQAQAALQRKRLSGR